MNKPNKMFEKNKPLNDYDLVKNILIKHDVLNKDIDQLDDPKLMQDLYEHFQEDMPYGTQKARTGDPDEFIYEIGRAHV